MSASLDDMPAYEHFQDELDLELKKYASIYTIKDLHIENEFIQYVCFELFLSKPEQITTEIIHHFFNENPSSKGAILDFIDFLNTYPDSYLIRKFNFLIKE